MSNRVTTVKLQLTRAIYRMSGCGMRSCPIARALLLGGYGRYYVGEDSIHTPDLSLEAEQTSEVKSFVKRWDSLSREERDAFPECEIDVTIPIK